MAYDAQGNWISPEEQTSPYPAAVPSYLTDTLGIPSAPSPEEEASLREDALRKTVAVMDFLHRFNAQSNALWGGAYGAVHGADTEGAPADWWTGVRQGIGTALGEHHPDINLSDFLKMQQPTKDMPWLDYYDFNKGYQRGWIPTAAAKLAVDLVGDPLTYEFAPARAVGLLPRAIKAAFPFLKEGQSLGGKALELTRIPKAAGNVWGDVGGNRFFGHGPATPEEQAIMDTAMRKNEQFTQDVNRMAKENEAKATEIMAPEPEIPGVPSEHELPPIAEQKKDLFAGIENPDQWPSYMSPDVTQYVDPLIEKRDEAFRLMNQAREAAGYKPVPDLNSDEYTQMLHQFFGKGPQDTGEAKLARIRGWFTGRPQSRELGKWRYADTGDEAVQGLVSKPEFLAEHGFEQAPEAAGREGWTYQGRPVKFDPQTTIKDILEAPNLNFDERMMQTNPFAAIPEQVRRQMGQKTFLDIVRELKAIGALRPATQAAEEATTEAGGPIRRALDYLRNITEDRPWRTPRVQGLTGYEAHPTTADWLENMAKAPFPTDTPFGKLNQLMENVRYSDIGELHHAALQTWKRTTLARVARWFMDEMSRIPQIYSEGNVAPWRILPEHMATWKARGWFPGQAFEGIPNEAWRDVELPIRQMAGKESASRYAAEEMGHRQGPGYVENFFKDIPGGSIPTKLVDLGSRYNQWMLDKVRIAEENHKIATMFNYLRTRHPDLGQIYQTNPDKFGELVDEAARFAKDKMGDYSRYGHTPSEGLAMETMPFYRWWRYAVPTVASNALEHPQRYSRMDRFYNTMFDTASPEEYENMPPWQKEQVVTSGMMGLPWDEVVKGVEESLPFRGLRSLGLDLRFPERQEPRSFSVGRGMHVQHLNELMISPAQSMLAKIDPLAKEIAQQGLNRNFFMSQPIDKQVAAERHAYPFKQLIQPRELAYHNVFGYPMSAAREELYGSLMPSGIQLKEYNELLRGIASDLGLNLFQDPNRNDTNTLEGLIAMLTGRKVYGWTPEKNERTHHYELYDQRQSIVRDLAEAEKRNEITDNQYRVDYYKDQLEKFDEEHGGKIQRPRKR